MMKIEIIKVNKGRARLPVLTTLFLEVTLRCNAHCAHCGSSCGRDQVKDELSAKDIKKALCDVAAKYNSALIMLNVTGGEPLLREDLFDIMTYAADLGFPWGMTTNGILINNSIIEKMKKSGMKTISISLDGLRGTHESIRGIANCHDNIIENVKMLKDAGFLDCLQITTVISKLNIHELDSMYDLIITMNVDSWRIMQVDSIGRARENHSLLLEKNELIYLYDFIAHKRKISNIEIITSCSHYLGNYEMKLRDWSFVCNAGVNIASILCNGDIYVCPSANIYQELIQGSIKNESFVNVWESKFEYFRNPERLNNSICENCIHCSYCMGDSFHTWDYCKNESLFCSEKIGLVVYPPKNIAANSENNGTIKFIHPTNGSDINVVIPANAFKA